MAKSIIASGIVMLHMIMGGSDEHNNKWSKNGIPDDGYLDTNSTFHDTIISFLNMTHAHVFLMSCIQLIS